MKLLQLPKSGRMTSQLGFGCAFPKSFTKQQVVYLLDAAYDAGIRHFDVAPFYINGSAEEYLGSFLAVHQDATVTTKYGLRPPSHLPTHIKAARVVLGPAVRLARRRLLGQTKLTEGLPLTAKASFEPSDVLKSVNRSLNLLKRSYIDLLLLHEADTRDVERGGLQECLNRLVADKVVGAFGIGGEIERVTSVYREAPKLVEVAQFNWDVTSGNICFNSIFRIIFRVVSRNLSFVAGKFAQYSGISNEWSNMIGLDMKNMSNVSDLMLKTALIANPTGIVLTTSTDVKHILRNAQVDEDSSLEQPAAAFRSILSADSGRRP